MAKRASYTVNYANSEHIIHYTDLRSVLISTSSLRYPHYNFKECSLKPFWIWKIFHIIQYLFQLDLSYSEGDSSRYLFRKILLTDALNTKIWILKKQRLCVAGLSLAFCF